jgi:hypothetical protein
VSLRKSHHEALISFETFQRIQERLNGVARARTGRISMAVCHRNRHKSEMARPTGFEPATCSFGGCHSIQLSYGRVALILQEIPRAWRTAATGAVGEDLPEA